MVYADYGYYRDSYLGGLLGEEDFPRLALRASEFLDYYTQGRAYAAALSEPVKKACCALAEQLQLADRAESLAASALEPSQEQEGREIQREAVGAHSVSWRSGGESAVKAQAAAAQAEERLGTVVRRYLTGTGLLYRGGVAR